jgi:hypothetical protein
VIELFAPSGCAEPAPRNASEAEDAGAEQQE